MSFNETKGDFFSFSTSGVFHIFNVTHEWLRHYASITQIHGVRWYNLAPNLLFRCFFIAFFLTFIIALPAFFINEGFVLYKSKYLSQSIELKKESNLTYPNVTVCYAKFFDKELMLGNWCVLLMFHKNNLFLLQWEPAPPEESFCITRYHSFEHKMSFIWTQGILCNPNELVI